MKQTLTALVLWAGFAAAISPLIFMGTSIVLWTWYHTDRDPGWGRQKEAFPLLVLTRSADGKHVAHVVTEGDVKNFTDYSFIVPASEREEIDRQLDTMRESDTPDPGKFQLLSLHVRNLPDGTQRIHLNASHYDDSINEGWYIARAKSIEPLYHGQHVGIGVGGAALFGSVIPTAILSALISAGIVLARTRITTRPAPGLHLRNRALRSAVIAAVIYAGFVLLMIHISDDPLWQDIMDSFLSLAVVALAATALWMPALRWPWRVALLAGAVAVAAATALFVTHEKAILLMVILVLIKVLILLAVSYAASRIFEAFLYFGQVRGGWRT